MSDRLDDFERKVKISDINYYLYEMDKMKQAIETVDINTVSFQFAMKSFVINTLESLKSMKELLEDIIKDKKC